MTIYGVGIVAAGESLTLRESVIGCEPRPEILDGAKKVRILGRMYPVRARVEQLHGFSAHADRNELLTWLKACDQPPRHIFVTHGEAATAVEFAAFAQAQTGWPASAPAYNQREILA